MNADTTSTYVDATDFKACIGRKYVNGTEFGTWYACSLNTADPSDMTEYVWARQYDSFKCGDGSGSSRINETMVGAIGDLTDSNWTSEMRNLHGNHFLLYDELNTNCDAAFADSCTIETNTIYMDKPSTTCSGTEVFRQKDQIPTRRCLAGVQFNCTGKSSFAVTAYANSDCTGSSSSKLLSSGCISPFLDANGTDILTSPMKQDVRVLQCVACPPLATAFAMVATFLLAFFHA
jgi:hypothetical protein